MTTDPSTERAQPVTVEYVGKVALEGADLIRWYQLSLADEERHSAKVEAERDALRAAYDHLLEAAVARWHETAGQIDNGKELTDWLEVSREQYAKWVENPAHIMEVPHD